MPSESFHGPSSIPSPQFGFTSEITAADGSPNGPHTVGALLCLFELAHENKNAIAARHMILFTTEL